MLTSRNFALWVNIYIISLFLIKDDTLAEFYNGISVVICGGGDKVASVFYEFQLIHIK